MYKLSRAEVAKNCEVLEYPCPKGDVIGNQVFNYTCLCKPCKRGSEVDVMCC